MKLAFYLFLAVQLSAFSSPPLPPHTVVSTDGKHTTTITIQQNPGNNFALTWIDSLAATIGTVFGL